MITSSFFFSFLVTLESAQGSTSVLLILCLDCLSHRNTSSGAYCFIKGYVSIFVLNTVWQFSGFSSQDCEKPGISCLTMHCNLSALTKEESHTIDIYMLLNTEILKKVSPGTCMLHLKAPQLIFLLTLWLLWGVVLCFVCLFVHCYCCLRQDLTM
jgi:hypothetical protein